MMQLSRALFLSSASTMYHGVRLWSVVSSIRSFAREYSTQRSRDSRSIGLSFHRLIGLRIRSRKRCSCFSSLTANQHRLEERASAEELLVVGLGAEAHDVFDAGAVVPAPVEQNDLAARREVFDVALKVPLSTLSLGGCPERDDSARARIEAVDNSL